MKKILFLSVLTLAAMLCFSCAGGAGSSDGDVGYLSLGAARAGRLSDAGITASALSSLTLKGTKDGTTKTLGSWSTGAEATGTTIAIEPGDWTFELSAKYDNPGVTLFWYVAKQTASIKAGKTTNVTLTMKYAGFPVSQAQTGYIIFDNGFCITQDYSELASMLSDFTVESIAVRVGGVSGGTDIYGIYPMQFMNEDEYLNIAGNIPAGWEVPSIDVLSNIYTNRVDIGNALYVAGSSAYYKQNFLVFNDS